MYFFFLMIGGVLLVLTLHIEWILDNHPAIAIDGATSAVGSCGIIEDNLKLLKTIHHGLQLLPAK